MKFVFWTQLYVETVKRKLQITKKKTNGIFCLGLTEKMNWEKISVVTNSHARAITSKVSGAAQEPKKSDKLKILILFIQVMAVLMQIFYSRLYSLGYVTNSKQPHVIHMHIYKQINLSKKLQKAYKLKSDRFTYK